MKSINFEKKKIESYKTSKFIFKIVLVCTLHSLLFF